MDVFNLNNFMQLLKLLLSKLETAKLNKLLMRDAGALVVVRLREICRYNSTFQAPPFAHFRMCLQILKNNLSSVDTHHPRSHSATGFLKSKMYNLLPEGILPSFKMK